MTEFHNAGYRGLYNGETTDDIFKRKKLFYREDILDNMNQDELVTNLFRINQLKQKLIIENIQGENNAKNVHYEVGKKVRKVIVDIGGMMPEDMPTPKNSLKELEKERKQLESKINKKLEIRNQKRSKKQEVIIMNENKTNINWLIPIYSTSPRNLYK